jgi:hypothetical protein
LSDEEIKQAESTIMELNAADRLHRFFLAQDEHRKKIGQSTIYVAYRTAESSILSDQNA